MKYAMTKHAIVGFSSSLRLEAERYGVRVSALCPAAVDTPMISADNPADLPRVPWVPNMRRYLSAVSSPIPIAQLAEEALRGVERNQELIIVPAQARLAAFLYRLSPAMVQLSARRTLLVERKNRPATP